MLEYLKYLIHDYPVTNWGEYKKNQLFQVENRGIHYSNGNLMQ